MSTEIWKEVPGYEGYYEVSDQGRVKSLARKILRIDGHYCSVSGRIMKLKRDSGGYSCCKLSKNGKKRDFLAHRLVLVAFVGPCPAGHESCHRDGNPANNSLDNLYWGTKLQNSQDSFRHGTRVKGETNGRSVLTEKDVREIIGMLKQGIRSHAEISEIFGISERHVRRIRNRKRWKHLTDVPTFRRGEGSVKYKLNEDDVRDIRRRSGTESTRFLAEKFGVSPGTIRDIKSRKSWANLDQEEINGC